MTRDRIFGEGTEFGEWLRRQESIPSSKVVATDCDFVIHRHKTDVNGLGVREVQAMMILEVKTRNAEPRFSQLDTMWLNHMCSNTRNPRRNVCHQGKKVFHEGVSVLSLSGTTPENSRAIRWGRFRRAAELHWEFITKEQLLKLLRFELHPDSLTPRPHRLHHATRSIVAIEHMPLGFSVPTIVTQRS